MRVMPRFLLAILVLLVAASASAKEYGHHDLKRLLTVADTPSGKKYGFDGAYLDQILNDLAAHARNYPPQFDTPQDRQRAIRDVQTLSKMLDTLIEVPAPSPDLLVRAGRLNSIGHNLDIAGAAGKADAIFQRLLAISPSDPGGNFGYGTFLAGTGKPKEAIPYLEKALAAGVVDAAYAMGMTWLTLGDKERALKGLEDYKRRRPADRNVDPLIDAIRNGKMEIRRSPR